MFGWYKEVSHDWWCFNIRTLFLPGRDQNENDGFPWQPCFKWILIDTKFINDNLLPDPRSIIIVAWKGDTANTDKLSHSPIEQWIQWFLKDLHLVLRLHFEFIWIAVVAEFNVGFSNFLVHSPSEGWLMFTMVLLEPCSCVSGKCLDSGCVASWWWWGWRFDIRQLLHGHNEPRVSWPILDWATSTFAENIHYFSVFMIVLLTSDHDMRVSGVQERSISLHQIAVFTEVSLTWSNCSI